MDTLPLPLRVVNRVGRMWRAAGGRPRALDADALVADVLKSTGRTDLGPAAEYRPALEVVLDGLDRAPHLSTVGRMLVNSRLQASLTHRANREDWKARAPERFATPVRKPLIIVGLPRTGTTFLHHLLASAPDARTLPMWQVARPFPPPTGPDTRRADNAKLVRRMRQTLPEFATKHDTGNDAPEECMHVMNLAFFAWTYWSMSGLPGYREWWWQADPTPAYRVWSDVLRFEQSVNPSPRFVLKSPSHTAHLDALLAAEPDARLVFTHRDPRSVVPSFASLLRTMRRTVFLREHLDLPALGTEVLDQLGRTADRARELRRTLPADRIVDVPFDELRQDPIAVVERVHRHFDLPWDDTTRATIDNAARSKADRKASGHRYTAEEFGLRGDAIAERIPSLL